MHLKIDEEDINILNTILISYKNLREEINKARVEIKQAREEIRSLIMMQNNKIQKNQQVKQVERNKEIVKCEKNEVFVCDFFEDLQKNV